MNWKIRIRLLIRIRGGDGRGKEGDRKEKKGDAIWFIIINSQLKVIDVYWWSDTRTVHSKL